ncbi:HRDC domain-containing protein [Flavobacterium filum]|uniref:HRDC domain-containing protein n=1 Tax=Flavobacterium filum TaxID=370974 RepID=UPI0023F4A8D0|nr:HRDC domain-containing protein [Flavobacterium filum]
MKVKHFRVRVSGEHLQNDQDVINQFLTEVTVEKTATNFITGMIDYWSVLVFYSPKTEKTKESNETEKVAVLNYEELTQEEKNTLNSFKHWRSETSNKLGLPQYMICHNSELMTIAKMRPDSIDELKKIKGFGQHKINRYGNDILSLLQVG